MQLNRKQIDALYFESLIKQYPYKLYNPKECSFFLRVSLGTFYHKYSNKVMIPLKAKSTKSARTYYTEGELIKGYKARFPEMTVQQKRELLSRFKVRSRGRR